MKAKNKAEYIEAWRAHVRALHVLLKDAGAEEEDSSELTLQWLDECILKAAVKAFPIPTGSGELPNGTTKGKVVEES